MKKELKKLSLGKQTLSNMGTLLGGIKKKKTEAKTCWGTCKITCCLQSDSCRVANACGFEE